MLRNLRRVVMDTSFRVTATVFRDCTIEEDLRKSKRCTKSKPCAKTNSEIRKCESRRSKSCGFHFAPAAGRGEVSERR